MRGWGGRQGASDVGLRDARPDAYVDERPDRCAACWIRGWTKVDRQSEGRYTFGVADKPEMLVIYPHKTSFRDWAYTFPEHAVCDPNATPRAVQLTLGRLACLQTDCYSVA